MSWNLALLHALWPRWVSKRKRQVVGELRRGIGFHGDHGSTLFEKLLPGFGMECTCNEMH